MNQESNHYDVIIIGAGFSGLYLIHRLRDELGLSVRVFEKGDSVGGTWFWNRYPGARCDVESMFYCYSFDEALQNEWTWSERYPAQPEILSYIEHVADRFDLRRSIEFGTTVEGAKFDESRNLWTVTTAAGTSSRAPILISAVGCLSVPSKPDFVSLEDYAGELLHTGSWPHEPVDFCGKRVAVVGTGSSGIQAIPVIAQQAASLTVFQRTATFAAPARNRPLTEIEQETTRRSYPVLREAARHSRGGTLMDAAIGSGGDLDPIVLRAELERRWWLNGLAIPGTLNDALVSPESNEIISQFVRDKIHEIVHDPETAKILEPHDYPIGTKRIVIDTGYFETFNNPHVHLVSIRDTPIERFTPRGIVVDAQECEFDAVVLATGYDAMTGALNRIRIEGVGGELLCDAWKDGPKTYLGLGVHGFPNMFTVTGPGSPSVFSNMVVSIEQHVDWITDYITYMRNNGIIRVEPTAEAQEQWVEHVNDLASRTLLPTAASWYMGANIPGKPRVFMPYIGGVGNYRAKCDLVAVQGYEGFSHQYNSSFSSGTELEMEIA